MLEPELQGRTISDVRVFREDVIAHPRTVRAFIQRLRGRRDIGILALKRRGKYLIIELTEGRQLIVHLRLSGHLALVAKGGETPKYERVRLGLDDGRYLSFVEPRALGRVYCLLLGEKPQSLAGMRAMGREPIEHGFGGGYLAERFRGRRSKVKAVLLDQRVCCGVGNIYSDEALFRAGIRPTRMAANLTRFEVNALARELRRVLNDGIRWCGTTMDDGRYRRPDGREGSFQSRLAVFGLEGHGCRECGSTIRTETVAGRTSHYCPHCQR